MAMSRKVKEVMEAGNLLRRVENKYSTRIDWWCEKNLASVEKVRKIVTNRLPHVEEVRKDLARIETKKQVDDLEKQKAEKPESWTEDHEKVLVKKTEQLSTMPAMEQKTLDEFNAAVRVEEESEIDITFKTLNIKYLPGWDNAAEKIYSREQLGFLHYMGLLTED